MSANRSAARIRCYSIQSPQTAPHMALSVQGPNPGERTVIDRWGDMMLAAKAGDDQAYDQLLAELHNWLSRYYSRRLSLDAAQDATQEVLLAIHARRYTYANTGPFGPWLASIARNKWTDNLRRRSKEPLPLGDDDFTIEDQGRSVRSALVLEEALSMLKPAQAAVIRLVKISGFSIDEAAERTGQSESLVKVNIHRGLKQIAALVNADA